MLLRKVFAIGFFGNIFEWYDFSVFAYLATVLGKVFFVSQTPEIALLKTFTVFSISYLVRPIGSIFFGALGDRVGRVYTLKLSMMLMAAPAFFIGLLPSFKTGGFVVVVILIALRLLQGFAAGGEFPGSACYVYEASNSQNKGFFCSVVAASPMLGVLCGSLAATIVFFLFSNAEVIRWAWRLPFLFSAVIVAFLFYIRKEMTDEGMDVKSDKPRPLHTLIKSHYRPMLKLMMLYTFISISFYLLFVWMPSYLHVYIGFSHQSAFLLSTVGLGALILSTMFFGYVSKRIGERNLAVFSILSITIAAYPAFIILQYNSLVLAYGVLLFFALCLGCIDGVIMSIMGDLFTKEIRCSGMSISFTIPTAVLGGLSPTVCTYLIYKTGWVLSPVLFLVLAGLVGLPAAFSLKKDATS